MAGLISKTTCNLSDANAFWRIEATNPGTFNATTLALTTNRNITTTFANAGNCLGAAISLTPATNAVTAASMKDVRVCLEQIMGTCTANAGTDEITFTAHGFSDGQEVEFTNSGGGLPGGISANVKYFARPTGSSVPANTFFLYATQAQAIAGGAPGLVNITSAGTGTQTLYAIRADKTLTGEQIVGGATTDCRCASGYWKDFTFTTGYAVDTNANKWLFNVSQGTGTNNWALRTSNGTAAAYVTWCDNQLSFTSGADWVYFKDVVTMTASASLTGAGNLSTGESTVSVAGIVGVGAAGITPSTVSNFLIPASTGTATLTLNGCVIIGGHAGVQIGSSASRYAAATPLTISLVSATSGTNTNSGFRDASRTVGSEVGQKGSLFIYGEYPSVEDAILNAAVGTGATSCTTTTSTGWVSGDTFYMGGINVAGVGTNVVEFTVSSTSGTTVNFSPATATNTRVADGRLVRSNGYGVIMNGASSSVKSSMKLTGMSNLTVSGVQIKDCGIAIIGGNTNYSYDDSSYCSVTTFEHCFYEATASATRGFLSEGSCQPSDKGFIVDNCNVVKGTFIGDTSVLTPISNLAQTFSFDNNIVLSSNFYSNVNGLVCRFPGATINDNVCENSSLGNIQLIGANMSFNGNIFWRAQSPIGALNVNNVVNLTGSGNIFNGCVLAIYLQNTVLNSTLTDAVFGSTLANTTDVDMLAGSYIDFELASPTGNVNVSTTNLPLLTPGSNIRISSNNDTVNNDWCYLPEGYYRKVGYGLADTLVNTGGVDWGAASAGEFAFRFEPTSGISDLTFSQKIPTGDISGKAMTIHVVTKINNAAFYGGTNYQLPKLTVNYDNGTEASFTAASSTDGQALSLTFIPVTSYGEITVTFTAGTDATGSNAYVYWGGFAALYPAGVTLNLGNMYLWARAVPITPMIATLGSPQDVWAVDPDTFITGTVGKYIIRILRLCGLIPAGL